MTSDSYATQTQRELKGKTMSASPVPLLELENLTTVFPTQRGLVRAVDGLSFRLDDGERLGIVGESGSGKSVTLLSVLRLVPHPGETVRGDVWYGEENLLKISSREMRQVRGNDIAMIFQDPMTTLNPAFRVGDQIRESLRIHGIVRGSDGFLSRFFDREGNRAEQERVLRAMADVGIPVPAENALRYPHQFSGGMQQRVLAAIALACEPRLLLADEPTTALDVTIQAQILDLLEKINQEHGTAIILVTHNLAVVAEFCQTIIVLYAGQLMEKGSVEQIIEDPMHPYTRGLLRCLPKISDRRDKILPIPGTVPDLAKLPPGCPFTPRCGRSTAECSTVDGIPLRTLSDGRLVRCLHC